MTDLSPLNHKGEKHGNWVFYIKSNILGYNGNYLNGKQVGLWIHYDITENNIPISKKYIIL